VAVLEDPHHGAERRGDAEQEAATLVWAAGVEANPVVRELGLPVDDGGRVVVDEYLRIDGVPNAWALGDCAAVPNLATPGELDPATCQHALRQARRLTKNGVRLRGFDGWVVARAYHLLQLPSITRRTRVLADWITSGIFRRDIAELTALNAVGATEVHRA
jgi:NADH dehydrogenase